MTPDAFNGGRPAVQGPDLTYPSGVASSPLEVAMYARVSTLSGVSDVDAFLEILRAALPDMRAQRGYRGLSASADRAAGIVGVLSLWETEADRDASESAMAKDREGAASEVGAKLTVENYEEMVTLMSKPPAVGAALFVTSFSMDPAKVEENIEFFKTTVAPDISSAPGFLALRNMINRQTGEGAVGTVWETAEARDAAIQMAMARRGDAAERGVTLGEPSRREVVLIDMP
jgi:heme-degrading monooxygenase HmoA